MAKGLWVAVRTQHHPHSYDDSTGPTKRTENAPIGAIVYEEEGDSGAPPYPPRDDPAKERLFKWIFFEGLTVSDLEAKVPQDLQGVTGAYRRLLKVADPENDAKLTRTKADAETDVTVKDRRTFDEREAERKAVRRIR